MTDKNAESLIRDPVRFEAISYFAGRIAHEFNNFLTPLTAYPQIIKEGLPEGGEQRELLDVLEKTARTMALITHQLTSLSSRAVFARQALNVNSVMDAVISQAKEMPEAGNVEFELELGEDIAEIEGAQDEIKEALGALLANAVEAMDEGGKVSVRTENVATEGEYVTASGLHVKPGAYVRVTVGDTGQGVPAHVKDRIFEPFVTTKKTSRKRRAGLGLTLAYRIMRDSHGAIDVESFPGKGAVFSLYFPTMQTLREESMQSAVPVESAANLVPRHKDKIIIVDDEKTIIRLFNMILSSAMPSLRIDSAGNGYEALEAFSAGHHGLLVMDLHMPVMDGQVAFNRIEQLCRERNWEMPAVVFCTGFAPPDMVTSIVSQSPIHCLLSKPVSAQTLVEAVKDRLR